MDRNRDEEIRRRAAKARNPVGNGQGDAQADDPQNEMNSPDGSAKDGSAKGDRPGSGMEMQPTDDRRPRKASR